MKKIITLLLLLSIISYANNLDCFNDGKVTYVNNDGSEGGEISTSAQIGNSVFLSRDTKVCDKAVIDDNVTLDGQITILNDSYVKANSVIIGDYEIRNVKKIITKVSNDGNNYRFIATETPTIVSDDNILDNNITEEKKEKPSKPWDKSFLRTHDLNYILPVTYDGRDHENEDRMSNEIKFQFSVKVPLYENIISNGDLYLAYTQKSLWQFYNKSDSSPFRETNYRPELFIDFDPNLTYNDLDFYLFRIGYVHESNGRDIEKSRSWDRLQATTGFLYNNYEFGAGAWWRLPEKAKNSPTDASGDDNPDLQEYIGRGFLYLRYKDDDFATQIVWKSAFVEYIERGSVEANLFFPLSDNIQWMIQYFYGYGESLIDYNDRVQRIGVGIVVQRW